MNYVEVITPYVSLFFCHWKLASWLAFPCGLFIALKISHKYLHCTPWVRGRCGSTLAISFVPDTKDTHHINSVYSSRRSHSSDYYMPAKCFWSIASLGPPQVLWCDTFSVPMSQMVTLRLREGKMWVEAHRLKQEGVRPVFCSGRRQNRKLEEARRGRKRQVPASSCRGSGGQLAPQSLSRVQGMESTFFNSTPVTGYGPWVWGGRDRTLLGTSSSPCL